MAVALMVFFTAVPSFAAEEGEKGASKEAYEHANRKSIFNRTSDWFSTVGKSQEEKDRIMEERNAKRAAQRAEREAAKAKRKATREMEKGEKAEKKAYKEQEKTMKKAGERTQERTMNKEREFMGSPGMGQSKGKGKAKGRK